MKNYETRKANALIYGVLTGVSLSIVMCVLFGIMDVQCWDSPLGRHWNAASQVCQAKDPNS